MKRSTIYTIGILAAVLTITTVPALALARGGGGGGGGGKGNCNKSSGMSTAQTTNSYQNQGSYQNQNKQQKRYRNQQNVDSSTVSAENGTNRGSGAQDRTRAQLRDPATHSSEATE